MCYIVAIRKNTPLLRRSMAHGRCSRSRLKGYQAQNAAVTRYFFFLPQRNRSAQRKELIVTPSVQGGGISRRSRRRRHGLRQASAVRQSCHPPRLDRARLHSPQWCMPCTCLYRANSVGWILPMIGQRRGVSTAGHFVPHVPRVMYSDIVNASAH